MYFCHKCKQVLTGENTCAVYLEEEANAIRHTSRLSVCPNCLKEISMQFTEQPTQTDIEKKGEEN